jgi:hypothetical protein
MFSQVGTKEKEQDRSFSERPDNCLFQKGVKEVKGVSIPQRQRRPLTAEGRQPLSLRNKWRNSTANQVPKPRSCVSWSWWWGWPRAGIPSPFGDTPLFGDDPLLQPVFQRFPYRLRMVRRVDAFFPFIDSGVGNAELFGNGGLRPPSLLQCRQQRLNLCHSAYYMASRTMKQFADGPVNCIDIYFVSQ